MQEVNIQTPYAYKLLISIDATGVTFWAHHKKNDEFLHIAHTKTTELSKTLRDNKTISGDFSEVKVVVSATDVAMMPKVIFDEDNAKSWYQLTHQVKDTDELMFEEVSGLDGYLIFPVNKNLIEQLKANYAAVEIHHEVGVFLRTLEQESDNNLNIRLHKNLLTLYAHYNGKLMLINSFIYQQPEDVVYFILNTCEQLGINPQSVSGNIINASDIFWNTVLLIQDYCPNIKPVKTAMLPQFDNTNKETDLLLYYLSKCE